MNEKIFIQKNGKPMPKSAEQCAAMRDEMRERILRESLRYFARNGFAGTKVADLARGIGIAQGTIYRYFDSKENLFSALRTLVANDEDVRTPWSQRAPVRRVGRRLGGRQIEEVHACVERQRERGFDLAVVGGLVDRSHPEADDARALAPAREGAVLHCCHVVPFVLVVAGPIQRVGEAVFARNPCYRLERAPSQGT